MIVNYVSALDSRQLILFSVDETLLPNYVNLSSRFREPPFSVEMFSFLQVSCESLVSRK